MCILSLFDVIFISNQYEMDLIWMELRTTHSVFAELKFKENTEKLLKFALERMEPFECKDIEKATLEIREQKQRLLELRKLWK